MPAPTIEPRVVRLILLGRVSGSRDLKGVVREPVVAEEFGVGGPADARVAPAIVRVRAGEVEVRREQ